MHEATASESGKPAVTVVVPDHSAYLNVLRQAVASTASLMGFDNVTVLKLQMAVDEACANVVEHGRTARKRGIIKLRLDALPEKLVMHVHDDRPRFSPLDQSPPTLEEYFGSSQAKGLGLVIINQFVDEIRHSYRSRTGNRLSLTKYLPKQQLMTK